ncbi:31783_t:CDS:2 [Gigaspora margarita]|uniref:31783_t:CDS:1 n=1 Tax=Gigaspora margarita TaxID=4874 RepID=A0ABN7WBD9_GIGMA|nr:31783_t:CDS:2 [Gigaspora margarita]
MTWLRVKVNIRVRLVVALCDEELEKQKWAELICLNWLAVAMVSSFSAMSLTKL